MTKRGLNTVYLLHNTMNDKPLKKKSTTSKKVVKKPAAKKTAAKKAVTKKTATSKPRKVATKTAAVPSKMIKAVAKPSSKSPVTTVIAKVNVGFGNQLFIRGDGSNLNWDQGIEMDNVTPDEWKLSSSEIQEDIQCKFLINDRVWSTGENIILKAGEKLVFEPKFS